MACKFDLIWTETFIGVSLISRYCHPEQPTYLSDAAVCIWKPGNCILKKESIFKVPFSKIQHPCLSLNFGLIRMLHLILFPGIYSLYMDGQSYNQFSVELSLMSPAVFTHKLLSSI